MFSLVSNLKEGIEKRILKFIFLLYFVRKDDELSAKP